MTVITSKSRRFNAARQQRLTFSRLLGATSLGAIACVATSGEVQAKVTVSHGNAAYTEAQRGAGGAAGKDNTQGNSCGTGPGGNGGTGPTASNGNRPLAYAPANSTATYNGSMAVVGSRGGNGGHGGNDPNDSGCVTNGGNGGKGGIGGTVNLTTNPGSLQPEGGYTVNSTGILVYSYGGNGGTGGYTTRKTLVGGDGGLGGNGGVINLTNNVGLNIVGGPTAFGIVAQSGGGQGGEGGFANNGDKNSSGGSGMPGGSGGNISVINNGAISTNGGMGIVAQSIGGFGGDAGVSVNGYGGDGGHGGHGGRVSINNNGNVTIGSASVIDCASAGLTNCNPVSIAVIAGQSVGGGGGDAGGDAGRTALGADGGFAGDGGTVNLVNTASLNVFGSSSVGMFAQSVGGGGGKGGFATASGRRAVAVGGSGGDGGVGGGVFLFNSGDICTGNACLTGKSTTPNNDDSAGGAFGLFAQSVGGGGGSGGYAKATSKTIFGGSAHATGGSGGGGGNGGEIALLNSGTIQTVEISSAAIFTQSIGGGGGNAGGAMAMATSFIGEATSVAHGGSGGDGGNGNVITVNCNSFSLISPNNGICGASGRGFLATPITGKILSTAGLSSQGILAQSVGGGGGSGGYAVALSAAFQGAFSAALGGSGGNGGNGGNIFASTGGIAVATQGLSSQGVLAQSIGGGGGSGGTAIDAALAVRAAVAVGIGGSGGQGGSGSSVTVENPGGIITTKGDFSQGLLAQSIGGGGGAGGSSISGAVGLTGAAVTLSVGGSGGGGGAGGKVSVYNLSGHTNQVAGTPAYGPATITTNGYGSSAILAQSIGGGGGNGGFAVSGSVSLGVGSANSIGGGGGGGGRSSAVTVVNAGGLMTTGGGVAALQAQSIGGGGGSGGFAIAGSYGGVLAASVGVGGSGGNGGMADTVNVSSSGNITAIADTTGNAGGILAQSMGGSGGSGGFAITGSLSPSVSASLSLGGDGGNGGLARGVSLSQSGSTTVTGDLSSAIVAQSLGGHGGTGGFAVAGAYGGGLGLAAAIGGNGGNGGTAGDVTVTLADASQRMSTRGSQSNGIVAQSIGGSGGNGGWSLSGAIGGLGAVSVSLGGSGGGGGRAGNVTLNSVQGITTNASLSVGILAQSIGGNGGSGGFSAALAGSTIVAPAVAVGGRGGNGSIAGTVSLINSGPIVTRGDLSMGILAQSIGGSGGNGGSALSGAIATGFPRVPLSVGAAGATGGNGGTGQAAKAVAVNSTGDIVTSGLASTAIIAQSIGGGGGNGGNAAAFSVTAGGGSSRNTSIAASVAIGGNGAAGGDAGSVTVNQFGNIVTGAAVTPGSVGSGDQSMGILAQSIGGSGGNGGSAYANSISGTGSVAVSVGGGGGVGGNGSTVAVNFNPYEYIASYNDLITNIGDNPARGYEHYLTNSIQEGRSSNRFNVLQYLENYSDLKAAFGNDLTAAARNYVTSGLQDRRTDQALAGVGVVAMPLSGSITTYGSAASAIYAQSIGGGGGNGGWSDATASSNKYAVSVAIGGYGGGGGNGSDVIVIQTGGALNTRGAQSNGIFAQSVGGGGGNGGAASASATGEAGGALNGGAASYSGTGFARQTNTGGSVTTAAQLANSGSSGSDEKADNGAAASLSIGGSGGKGGSGGRVLVENAALITTSGDLSSGVFAQSVGGGGGNGGSSTANGSGGNYSGAISLGGAGGVGGNSADVSVTSMRAINTGGNLSTGIFAQSVGGGGGNGGSTSSSATSGGTTALSFALGGSGGGGGTTGVVLVKNNSAITTLGSNSAGIFAQSVGGGGGNGGAAITAATAAPASSGSSTTTGASTRTGPAPSTPSNNANSATASHNDSGGQGGAGGDGGYAVGMSLGGAGGSGSAGNAVSVANSGSITTGSALTALTNPGSAAIFAQSVGGGGGNGGSSSTNASAGKASVALSMGGNGAGVGAGGAVKVTQSGGSLTTYAANSSAIFAQSVGGGGGNGGSTSSTTGAGGSTSVAIGLAGTGGGGGAGGKVLVCGTLGGSSCATATGGQNIITYGAGSFGIFAQSVGGGGGNGGAFSAAATATSGSGGGSASSNKNSAGNADANAASGVAVAMGLGGNGGGGGSGATVEISNAIAITTTGEQATAIQAQSVGGGGGNGGSATSNANGGSYAVAAVLGGSGATGGAGNNVSLTNAGAITTSGALAYGLFAQSVGGGGGSASASSATSAGGGTASVGLTLGGSGGSGQDGGAASIISDGQISTTGAGAIGLIAQSIGGGGGVSGNSRLSASSGGISATLNLGGTASDALDLGTDGNGRSVRVSYSAGLSTTGANAVALVAQSIGGGGGVAGFTDQSAGTNSGTASGRLGQGRGSGSAGDVTVGGSGAISTRSVQAIGILAQSISNGGGLASLAASPKSTFMGNMKLGATDGTAEISGAVSVSTSGGTITTNGNFAYGLVAQSVAGGGGVSQVITDSASLGGKIGGTAKAVSVTNNAAITTSGTGAVGIVAQSIGGGGGLAISSSSAHLGAELKMGTPSTSADAANVTIVSNAAISTSGIMAIGILAQSVGGGGGAVLSSGNGVLGSTSGVKANSGTVRVDVNASITTSGRGAHGVVAQSVAGGGGLIVNSNTASFSSAGAGGRSGIVTVNVRSGVSITTQALGTSAIYAYSSTDPVLNIEEGASLTGGVGGHAALLDSPINLINNSGIMSTMDGAAGAAINSLSGDTTIANSGTLMGSIKLHDGAANLLHNLAGGTVQSGASIDLGATGHFMNDGILANAMGGGSVLVNGNFTQSAAGSMRIGIDHNTGLATSFNILGAAQLEGKLAIATLNAGSVRPGSFKHGIVSATGGLATRGLVLSAAKSAILSYALSTEDGALGLVATANFTPEGLGGAGNEIGMAFGMIQAEGGSVLSRRLTAHLVGLDSTGKLEEAYKTLGAGGISIVPKMVLASAQRSVRSITDRLDGWRLSSSSASGLRVWMTPAASAGSGAGLSTNLRGITLGTDAETGSGSLLLGAAFSYMDASSRMVMPHSTAQGGQYALSLYTISRFGPAYVSAVAHAATGTTRFNRRLDALGLGIGGSLSLASKSVGARLEAGYAIDIGGPDGHIAPFASIEPMLVVQEAGIETLPNARESAITFHKKTITALPMSLGIQVDGRWKTGGGGSFSPLLQVAWVHDFRTDRKIGRSFGELPSLLISRTTVPTDTNAASIRFGGQWSAARFWSIQASAETQVSRSYGTIGGMLSVRYAW
jgi:hypothetical protein